MAVQNSKTFDVTDPKRHVTDPQGLGAIAKAAGVPKSLYRAATPESDEPVIVAWRGREAVYNEVRVAETREDLHALIAAGWSETGPVMPVDAPAPSVGRKARAHAAA